MSTGEPWQITDLVEGGLSGAEWDAWLLEHPDAAAEVEIARRVQALLAELRTLPVVVPPGFEARLMERVCEDATLLELLDLALGGAGRAVLELLGALFGLMPAPEPVAL